MIAPSTLALAGCAILLLAGLVAILAFAMLTGPRRIRPRRWLVGGGLVLPMLAAATLLAHSALVPSTASVDAGAAPMRIQVSGRQWWWELRYTGPDGRPFASANELHLPRGRPVVLELTSADVLHAFRIPGVTARVDMVPGRVARIVVNAARTGVFRGQCMAFCGTQHTRMALLLVVQDEETFEAWRANQAAPAAPPQDPVLRAGRDLFLQAGCGGCHTVRGTEARGEIGPDLTHVRSRRMLAAGTLPNVEGALADWTAHSQRIKAGSLMPSASQLHEPQLRLVAGWLRSLQ